MKEQQQNLIEKIEEETKKWLISEKINSYVESYAGDFDLDNCCLDGYFDLNELQEKLLSVIINEIKKEIEEETKIPPFKADKTNPLKHIFQNEGYRKCELSILSLLDKYIK